jgi:hypothetical protein
VATEATGRAVCWKPERRPWGWGDVIALLVWTAAIVAFFWDAITLRGALFYFDITEINFPYREFFASELKAGRFSRWLPNLYCGLPLYSESQAGYLHPLKYLLYPWMPTWAAFNWDTILSVWLTGVGTYGWLRRHVAPTSALTGASLFGLSGFVWAHLIHTSMINALASVPFAFWALEVTWANGLLRGMVIGAFAIACQVFAGHLQDTILTGLAVGLYGLYRALIERGARHRAFALSTAVGMVLLAAILSAVQWIPSKELIDRSPRAAGMTWGELTFGSWHPELLPTTLIREAYGTRASDTDWTDGFYPYHEMNVYLGAIGMALAVVGAAAYRDRWVAFWILLAGLGTLLMLGRFTFVFDPLPRIPVLNTGRIPVRYHLWVSLAVAALAAVGVDRLSQPGRVRLRWALLFLATIALLCVPILYHIYEPIWAQPERWPSTYHRARYRWLGTELTTAVVRTAILGAAALAVARRASRLASPQLRRRIVALLPLLVMADLLGSHLHDVPTVHASYWTKPPASVEALKSDSGLIRISGFGVLSSGEPGYASSPGRIDFFRARDTIAWSLPPAWGLSSSSGITPIIPMRFKRYGDNVRFGEGRADVEGVSHILTGEPSRLRGWDRPRKAGSAYIHHNPNVLPRARLMGRPVYVSNERAAVQALRRLRKLIREQIIVEDPSHPLPENAEASGSAKILTDLPEHVVVETESGGDAYLFLADAFDPGWSATLDGNPVPIRPAQIAFRAVYVPKGAHRIVFTYEPAGFRTGLAITVAGLFLGIILMTSRRAVATLGPEHGDSGWPDLWPLWFAAISVFVVGASAIAWIPGQGVAAHPRWSGSWHRFTWGAKLEAMRPPPPPDD